MTLQPALLWVLIAAFAFCASTDASIEFGAVDTRHKILERLWHTPLPISERLLRSGYKFDLAEGRNWARLAQKLFTPGSNVTVGAFGGSVTVGHIHNSTTSYPEEFVRWLKRAFPSVNFRLVNQARRATASTFASLCLVQDLPEDTDLTIVEYSVNGYGGHCQCFTAPQVAGYEALVRKVLKRVPHTALLGFAAFIWVNKAGELENYYWTGEDQHAVVAKRYGFPMVSVRDALYDIVFEDELSRTTLNMTRKDMLVDTVHPSDAGAVLYAAFAAWALRHLVTHETVRATSHAHVGQHPLVAALASGLGTPPTLAAPPPMPKPINPEAAQEHWPTFCAEGLNLPKQVVSGEGWAWVDEGSNDCPGCHKYGYTADQVGAALRLRVNTAILNATEVARGANVSLALSFLKSWSKVGVGHVSCISGCTCATTRMDAKGKTPTSEIHTERMMVSAAPECVVEIKITEETNTGGHKFRLSGVAVHQLDSVSRTAYAPVYD